MPRNGMKEVMQQIKKPPRRLGRPDAAINAARFRIGRCQLACRRAFIAANGRPLSTWELLAYAFPRSKTYKPWQRWSINRAVRRFGAPLARAESGRGAPMIWQPKPELMRLINPKSV